MTFNERSSFFFHANVESTSEGIAVADSNRMISSVIVVVVFNFNLLVMPRVLPVQSVMHHSISEDVTLTPLLNNNYLTLVRKPVFLPGHFGYPILWIEYAEC